MTWAWLLCRVLGWHVGRHRFSFDGASVHAECGRCGDRVLQDSQGNWFSVEERTR
jgi:hypothetical protein